METVGTRFRAFCAAICLISVAFVATLVPSASAHTCRAYDDRCDPNGCKEGEDHDHTRLHHWPEEDESCISKKKDPEPTPPPTDPCSGRPLLYRLICEVVGPSSAVQFVPSIA